MKFVKAPVLFAFFAVLVSFTAMASLGDTVSAGGNTISSAAPAPQAKEGDLNLRAVEAAERSATAAEGEAVTDKWILGTTIAAFIAAAIAAFHSKRSADAAIKAVEDNEKYNKIQTRAYTLVKIVLIKNIKEKPYIRLRVINSGETHSIDTKVHSKMELYRGKINELDISDDFYEYKNKDDGDGFIIRQKGTSTISKYYEYKEHESYETLSDDLHFIIYGTICYRDVFDEKHETHFCRYLKNRDDRSFTNTKHGNWAT